MKRPALARAAAITAAALIAAFGVTVTPAAASTSSSTTAIVAMGDSAISGEGAGTDTNDAYVTGTDTPTDYCHRSTKSEIFETGLSGVTPINLACSGAQTGDIVSNATYAAITGTGSGDFGEAKQDVQLAAAAASYKVKMIVLTIGANDDFDFSGIMSECVARYFPIPLSTGCRTTIGSATIQSRIAAVIPKVEAALADIRATMTDAGYAASDYQLVLQSYFTPITPAIRSSAYVDKVSAGCPIEAEDLAWGHNFVVPAFDDGLRTAAEAVPGVRFLDQRRTTYGHEVCAESTTSALEYTNGDVIDTSERTRNGCDVSIGTLGLCENEVRQSFHPRVAGYAALGNCLGLFYAASATEEYCTPGGTGLTALTSGASWWDTPSGGSWFTLTNAANGNLLDIEGADTVGDSTKGRSAITWAANGGLNQSFVFVAESNGSYVLQYTGNTAMCLDAADQSSSAGTKLRDWTCNSTAAQTWNLVSQGGGRYELVPQYATSMAATISTDTTSSGNAIIELEPSTGATNQLWHLTQRGVA